MPLELKMLKIRHSTAGVALVAVLLALLARGASSSSSEGTPALCDSDIVAIVEGDGYTAHDEEDMELHSSHVELALEKGDQLQFVVYGDSITEALSEAADALNVYAKYFEMTAFGISGDKSGELLWRILRGEYNTDTMAPHFVSILVGTNDLRKVSNKDDVEGNPDLDYLDKQVSEVVASITSIVSYIHEHSCETQFILQAILPTAYKIDNFWPNQYTPAIVEANERLEKFAKQYPEHVTFVSCWDVFLEDGKLKQDIMGDLLHPNEEGHVEMAKCILGHTGEILKKKVMKSIPVYWSECSEECGGGWQQLKTPCKVNNDWFFGLDEDWISDIAEDVCKDLPPTWRECNNIACPSPPPPPLNPPPPPTPPAPDVPAAPDAPPTPPAPAAPDSPPTPEAPDAPDSPPTLEVPAAPGSPPTPEAPDAPDSPPTPEVPAAPDSAPTPEAPASPDSPPTPEAPAAPEEVTEEVIQKEEVIEEASEKTTAEEATEEVLEVMSEVTDEDLVVEDEDIEDPLVVSERTEDLLVVESDTTEDPLLALDPASKFVADGQADESQPMVQSLNYEATTQGGQQAMAQEAEELDDSAAGSGSLWRLPLWTTVAVALMVAVLVAV